MGSLNVLPSSVPRFKSWQDVWRRYGVEKERQRPILQEAHRKNITRRKLHEIINDYQGPQGFREPFPGFPPGQEEQIIIDLETMKTMIPTHMKDYGEDDD